MTKIVRKLTAEIQRLSDMDKLQLVDEILAGLDKPDPEIDRVWAKEARKRWAAYKTGRMPTLSYKSVMGKYRHR